MRDLNLGPDTKRLVQNWRVIDEHKPRDDAMISACATAMAAMLERWMTVAWCWHDNCPANICAGPHVTVHYEDDKAGSTFTPCNVIEPYNKIGTTFAEVPYRVLTDQSTGLTRRVSLHKLRRPQIG